MPRIPESELERVKREIDLVALVRSKGIELKRHGGKDLAGRCPFHEDDTASFIVTPAKNLWHCMGCGKGGSVIDFAMAHEGLSFRHAFEVLAAGDVKTLMRASAPVKHAFAPKLESPVAFDADDRTAIAQVIGYYRERLKCGPVALEYLRKRGISPEAVEHFKIGFADRTLGLRLPSAVTKAGGEIRERLKKIGLMRAESGHEHFNGCVVFPIEDQHGHVTEIYGRKVYDNLRPGTLYHLYLPGQHVGIFNRECLTPRCEIILCESVIDALSFWCAGFRNVTCIYGTEGFTEELWRALLDAKVQRVHLAYDRDAAGDRAAERDSRRLLAVGIECLRVKFPSGMDANEYARKVTPADKSLRLILHSAEWLGKGNAPDRPEVLAPVDHDMPAPAHSSFLAAELAADTVEATKEKSPTPADSLPVDRQGEDVHIAMGDRQWRIRGLDKNNSHEVLRVNLRIMYNGLFYINVIDLYQDKQRRHFIEEAAKETVLDGELIKRDMGRLLLQLETMQEERIRAALAPAEPSVPSMSDEERREAMELLRDPGLLHRILADFEACGVVGEDTNKLVGYLAAVSRKFAKPLGVIIQSTSAAGKTTLMEAVLSFVPEEERVKYSAMTGQALFYLGEQDIRHKILAIAEEEGAEKATYALKLLQSEGELTIASTGKDPQSGLLTTQTYHVQGPVMIFFTTTSIELDEELANRCLTLTVDESREQTRRIHALQREEETIGGYIRAQKAGRLHKLHQNAQRLLQALPVHNPFAARLTFPDESTRLRRDQKKYLALIRAIALLHQHQRPRRQVQGVEHIEVSIEDIAEANRLAGEVLGRSLDEMPPQTRRFLNLLHGMAAKTCEEQKMEMRLCRFSQREARENTGWSAPQVKRHLNRLAELEYVLPHRGRYGQGFVYELVYGGEGADGSKFLPGLIDADELRGSLLPLDYDADRDGQNAQRDGQNGHRDTPGMPQAPHRHGAGAGGQSSANPYEQGNGSRLAPKSPKNAHGQKNGNHAS